MCFVLVINTSPLAIDLAGVLTLAFSFVRTIPNPNHIISHIVLAIDAPQEEEAAEHKAGETASVEKNIQDLREENTFVLGIHNKMTPLRDPSGEAWSILSV